MKKLSKHIGLLLAMGVLSNFGCAAEEPVPLKPTWVNDVYPILQGNCLHCHGSESQRYASNSGGVSYRFDFFRSPENVFAFLSDDERKEIGLEWSVVKRLLTSGRLDMESSGADPNTRMPPPPALPLEDRDRRVLLSWLQLLEDDPDAAFGTRAGNLRPRAKLLGEATVDDDRLLATIDITDAEGDSVVGHIIARDANDDLKVQTQFVDHSGRIEIDIDVSSLGNEIDLLYKLTDGLSDPSGRVIERGVNK